MDETNNYFGEVIYGYSQAQAVADGVLVDISQIQETKDLFLAPVFVKRVVWEKYIDWDDQDTTKQTYQDVKGRLWDMLWMLNTSCRDSL